MSSPFHRDGEEVYHPFFRLGNYPFITGTRPNGDEALRPRQSSRGSGFLAIDISTDRFNQTFGARPADGVADLHLRPPEFFL